MRLTHFSNFALRTLMFAAARTPDLARAQDVADAFGMSRAHTVKCVHQLGQWGYLETVRGRSGGFRLARPARQITIGEVVRLTEDSLELVECFNAATNSCPLMQACRLSRAFKKAMAAFMAELDCLTIADVVSNRGELIALMPELDGTRPAPAAKAV